MSHLSIRLLGSIQVTLAGEPVTGFVTDKERALLAYLAVEADRPHRREALAGLLWGDQPDSAARGNLRRALADLRRALGDHDARPPFLLIDRQTIQINRAADVWIDIDRFAALLEMDQTLPNLEEAVDLCRGSFLEGFSLGDCPAFEEWSLLQREHVNRLVLSALRRLVDDYEARGTYEQALTHSRRRIDLDPWQEDAHRQVMRLLTWQGQRSAALSQYKVLRSVLREELDIEPEAESRRLYEQIKDEELPPPPGTLASMDSPKREARLVGACPYRGLTAFREVDAPFFHGRDGFVERLMAALHERPVVAIIVGSSGSGKSSAVFAGLLPRLRREEGWQIAHFRPGGQPFHALAGVLLPMLDAKLSETDQLIEARTMADALRDERVFLADAVDRILEKSEEADRLLLVIDQSEELYTLCPDPDEQRHFVDRLLDAAGSANEQVASPLVLLITLRADFMGHALAHRPLADALQDASLMMGPMNREELRRVIEQPAAQQGAAFEPGLVERLLDDVGEEPGNLPMLEFALTLMWETQTDGWLTHAGYEEIGRVDGALAGYAEHAYEELGEVRRDSARRVFTQLVRPGEGTDDTRRLATRAELGDEGWTLAQHLADRRLVVTGQSAAGDETVEVVHEALIQRWGRLRAWMDADRTFRTWQEDLRAALRAWDDSGRDDGALLRGIRLGQAESWVAERGPELSDAERGFIEASAGFRERSEAEQAGRRRRTIFALTGGLLIAAALAIFAFTSRAIAQREADVNHSLALAADAQDVVANGDGDLALALALEAVDIDEPPPEARRTLSAVAFGVGTRAVLEGHSQAVRSAALGPEARLALSGSCATLDTDGACTAGELILWNLEDGAEAARFEEHTNWVNGVAFSPDGTTAISASGDGTLILWDVTTGDTTRTLANHTGGVNTVAFGPDGTTAISGSDDGTLTLWDIATGDAIRSFAGHGGPVNRVVFSPDGTTAISASGDASLILWDVATGNIIRRSDEHADAVTDAAFHPDGRTVLSVGRDLSLREWDLATGESSLLRQFPSFPASLAIAPDGRTALVSVRADLAQWSIGARQETGRLSGHGVDLDAVGHIHSVAISGDGMSALSAGSDGTLRLWNLGGQSTARRFDTDGTPMEAVAVDTNGSRLLTGLATGEVVMWDIEQGRAIRHFSGEGLPVSPDCLAFSPSSTDGSGESSALVCTVDPSGATTGTSLVLWDLDADREVRRFEGHVAYVRALAFSPDGRSFLAGSQTLEDVASGDLIHWDLDTGHPIRRFNTTLDITNIAMGADGSLALTGSTVEPLAILWDVASGEEIRRFQGHETGILNVAFGPDEATVVTASWDGTLILWNVDTGEPIRRYVGHESSVWGLDVSPDGRFLLSSASDGTVVLWDLDTGEERVRIAAHTATSFDVAFHPNGESFFSVGSDGELIEWLVPDLPLDEQVEWAHANRYVRELTCEEQERYRIDSTNCG